MLAANHSLMSRSYARSSAHCHESGIGILMSWHMMMVMRLSYLPLLQHLESYSHSKRALRKNLKVLQQKTQCRYKSSYRSELPEARPGLFVLADLGRSPCTITQAGAAAWVETLVPVADMMDCLAPDEVVDIGTCDLVG
jgi:hypothetical protein